MCVRLHAGATESNFFPPCCLSHFHQMYCNISLLLYRDTFAAMYLYLQAYIRTRSVKTHNHFANNQQHMQAFAMCVAILESDLCLKDGAVNAFPYL